ncbi:MAG: response regulator transcription factor [Microlunatus sp.]|nr:response regulator transcription factor [Microlunatus sp.]MDN5804052.1 response regulator transcription factor [Microlunatus sp.]
MSASRIVVVEDSDAIRLSVAAVLRAHGYAVDDRADGADLESLLGRPTDLVLLDVMLPGRDGFELLEIVRRTSAAAVIMLTARDATADRVRGLTAGADDYLVKPFAMAELLARIKAVLRRSRPVGGTVRIGDLEFDDDLVRVTSGDRPVQLTQTERRVLAYLASHPDQIVSKTQLLTAVWGYDGFADNLVEVNVSSLRRKLEAEGQARVLHTVRGRGYLLSPCP